MLSRELAHERAISIHALREEGDLHAPCKVYGVIQFLSTPSARRATDAGPARLIDLLGISIHALREEGDKRARDIFEGDILFLSTPSARRATRQSRRP